MSRDAPTSAANLINTSRGQVIDEKSLIKILSENKISGAALDVFENEPIHFDHELFNFNNVILTPHIGSATVTARSKMAEICGTTPEESVFRRNISA